MENKQTAVEWLHKLSKEREPDKFDWEEAKQMEKEQIIHAHIEGQRVYRHPHTKWINAHAEHYYNETYEAK